METTGQVERSPFSLQFGAASATGFMEAANDALGAPDR